MNLAHKYSARLPELRIAVALGRFWSEHGKRAEAVVLVQDLYSGFSDGFDTTDLKNAKVLLEALS